MILDRVVQLQSAGHGSPSSVATHDAPSSAFWRWTPKCSWISSLRLLRRSTVSSSHRQPLDLDKRSLP